MKVTIIGDTHGRLEYGKILNLDTDIVIVAGDFGLPFYNDNVENQILDTLDKLPYKVCFVDGNHENFDYLKNVKTAKRFGNIVGLIRDNVYHLKRGSVYVIGGMRFFTFGGARSVDIGFRTPGIDWWDAELPNWAEMDKGFKELDKNQWEVDYVITHTAPFQVFVRLASRFNKYYYYNDIGKYFMEYLDDIYTRLSFKKWFCGHYHVDAEVDRCVFLYNNAHIIT